MKSIYNTINNNYKADGTEPKRTAYVQFYEKEKELIDQFGSLERFESLFEGDLLRPATVKKLKFPIITFDVVDSGEVFDSKQTREDILINAKDYFTKRTDDSVWEFEKYNVYEETDLLRFEDIEGNVLGYVQINLDVPYLTVIEELERGIDPISDGWEDGLGNTISLDGWGNLENN